LTENFPAAAVSASLSLAGRGGPPHAMSTAAVKLSGKLTVDQVKEFISTLEAADGIEPTVSSSLSLTAAVLMA